MRPHRVPGNVPSAPRVAVLAASGHTGRMVVEALKRRGADVKPLTRADCDARDRQGVARAIHDVDAVINLAGPFLANGLAPVLAARDAGIPYVDTTGEQAFMMDVRRAIHGGPPVVNACAFEYAFGDLAAKLHFPEGGDALDILYRNRHAGASAGTKKSILHVIGAPTLVYERGELHRTRYAAQTRTFLTADGPRAGVLFAGGEVLTVPHHTEFRSVRTFIATSPRNARLSKSLAPLAGFALRGPVLAAAKKLVDARHEPPRNERARGEIHLVSGHRHVVVTTPDPYLATAEMAAEGALRLVGRKDGGVLAPAEAFDARDTLDTMAKTMPGFDVAEMSAPEGERV